MLLLRIKVVKVHINQGNKDKLWFIGLTSETQEETDLLHRIFKSEPVFGIRSFGTTPEDFKMSNKDLGRLCLIQLQEDKGG